MRIFTLSSKKIGVISQRIVEKDFHVFTETPLLFYFCAQPLNHGTKRFESLIKRQNNPLDYFTLYCSCITALYKIES